MHCLKCQAETSNPNFCSRSCSVSYNNSKSPKRKPEGSCKNCSKPITKGKYYCKPCSPKKPWKDISLAKAIYKNHHRSSAFAIIRTRARATIKRLKFQRACQNCGYDKHIEVCHVRPISDYPLTTMISEINQISNLRILCPNCHWESENGYLNISLIVPLEGIEPTSSITENCLEDSPDTKA